MKYAKSLCILHAMIYLMKINHTFFQSLQDNLFMRFGHRLAHHYQDVRARGSHTARKRRNTTLHNLRPGVLLEEFFIFFFCKNHLSLVSKRKVPRKIAAQNRSRFSDAASSRTPSCQKSVRAERFRRGSTRRVCDQLAHALPTAPAPLRQKGYHVTCVRLEIF